MTEWATCEHGRHRICIKCHQGGPALSDARAAAAEVIYLRHGCTCEGHYSEGEAQHCRRDRRRAAEQCVDDLAAAGLLVLDRASGARVKFRDDHPTHAGMVGTVEEVLDVIPGRPMVSVVLDAVAAEADEIEPWDQPVIPAKNDATR